MALLPSVTQIPAQRVQLNERNNQSSNPNTPQQQPTYLSREWYRFFDSLHTYIPTPAAFTPSITSTSNVAVLTPGVCFYTGMGSVVTVTGGFTLKPTVAGDTSFRMAPPVLDDLTVNQAAGMFITTAAGFSDVGSITVAGGLLEFRVNAVNTGPAVYVFNANYQIV